MEEENNFIEIDEETISDVKWGIVKYIAIFLIFVFAPLMITVLTSNSISKLNIFAGFVGLTLVCVEQVVTYAKFLMAVSYENIEDTEENN